MARARAVAQQRGVVLHTVAVGPYPWVAVDAGRGRAFVTTRRAVLMLDAASGRVLRTIPVQAEPGAITVDERRGHIFVTGAQAVSIVDTRTGRVLRTIPRGGRVVGIDDHSDRVNLWGDGRLSVLDGQTGVLLGTVVGGLSADVVAISPRRRRVLVAATDPAENASGPATARLVDGYGHTPRHPSIIMVRDTAHGLIQVSGKPWLCGHAGRIATRNNEDARVQWP